MLQATRTQKTASSAVADRYYCRPPEQGRCLYFLQPLDQDMKLPMWPHHEAPTTGMLKNCCSLVPLKESLNTWFGLSTLLCWLIRTIRLDYAIQFARCLPKFNVSFFPQCEVCGPAAKHVIEPVSPTKMKRGFYSPHSIILEIGGGLRPILGLY